MDFKEDGLYLYKRPVRSASSEHGMLLAQLGTILHHVIVYVKSGKKVVALEYGPAADETGVSMDVTSNILTEAPAGPIFLEDPEMPEKEHLPMLYVAAPHHPLDSEHVVKAINFAGQKSYQALKNNCIAFADFITRVLTGGRVRNAPLIFDHVAGKIPLVDSPMLPLFQAMLKMTWHEIADGSRLMQEFIASHGPHYIIPLLTETEASREEDIGDACESHRPLTKAAARNAAKTIDASADQNGSTASHAGLPTSSSSAATAMAPQKDSEKVDLISTERWNRPKKGISMLPPRRKLAMETPAVASS